jgi:hypothetical protein
MVEPMAAAFLIAYWRRDICRILRVPLLGRSSVANLRGLISDIRGRLWHRAALTWNRRGAVQPAVAADVVLAYARNHAAERR